MLLIIQSFEWNFSKEVKNRTENAMQIKNTKCINLCFITNQFQRCNVITANNVDFILNRLTLYLYITC